MQQRVVVLGALTLVLLAWSPSAWAETCGGLDYAGTCEGTVAQWCENGEVIQLDCADHGALCGWDAEHGYFTCVDADEALESCDAENAYSGTCADAQTVVWCNSDGTIDTMSCKDGMVCDWNDAMGYFDCVFSDADISAPEEVSGEDSNTPPPQTDGSDELSDPVADTNDIGDSNTATPGPNTPSMEENSFLPPAQEGQVGCRHSTHSPTGLCLFLLLLMLQGAMGVRRACPSGTPSTEK